MQLVALTAIADALNEQLEFEDWQTSEGDTLEDARTQADIDHYYQQRQKEEEIEMFSNLCLEEPSLLEKAGHLYECAFNWVLHGQFLPTTRKLDINRGIGAWLR